MHSIATQVKGDWIGLVQKDKEKYSIYTSEEQIMSMRELDFRQLIKKKIKEHSFRELTNIKTSHIKVKNIQHTSFSGPQKYLLSNELTRKRHSLLYNLRCQSDRGIKDNFHRQLKDLSCPLKCLN